jgi:hypothetical protein
MGGETARQHSFICNGGANLSRGARKRIREAYEGCIVEPQSTHDVLEVIELDAHDDLIEDIVELFGKPAIPPLPISGYFYFPLQDASVGGGSLEGLRDFEGRALRRPCTR